MNMERVQLDRLPWRRLITRLLQLSVDSPLWQHGDCCTY